jgi:hypothetical protein
VSIADGLLRDLQSLARSLVRAVFVGVMFSCFVSMVARVGHVAVRGVSVVTAFFVISGFVMLGGFAVVMRSLVVMLCCL